MLYNMLKYKENLTAIDVFV